MRLLALCPAIATLILLSGSGRLHAQTTSIQTEYLMTLFAPLEAKQDAGDVDIYNVVEGGWVKGPKIKGKLIAPAADWFRPRDDGTGMLDVRGSIRTDDGAIIYIEYRGILAPSSDDPPRAQILTTPYFKTSAPNYQWLNRVVAVGKSVPSKPNSVQYDIFQVK